MIFIRGPGIGENGVDGTAGKRADRQRVNLLYRIIIDTLINKIIIVTITIILNQIMCQLLSCSVNLTVKAEGQVTHICVWLCACICRQTAYYTHPYRLTYSSPARGSTYRNKKTNYYSLSLSLRRREGPGGYTLGYTSGIHTDNLTYTFIHTHKHIHTDIRIHTATH